MVRYGTTSVVVFLFVLPKYRLSFLRVWIHDWDVRDPNILPRTLLGEKMKIAKVTRQVEVLFSITKQFLVEQNKKFVYIFESVRDEDCFLVHI